MPQAERIIAGAMSGTSADGVDIALARISGHGIEMSAQLLLHHHRPYDANTRAEIFAFRGNNVRDDVLRRLAQLGRHISLTYAVAVNEALAAAHLGAADLAAVAAHGQTLFHSPPNTIQWLDPALIAAEVGCAVVSDFRRADLAAGGQGAPLVPFADYILFRHPTKSRVLLNLGGIANITYLKPGARLDEVIAFDTGPGNCISDWLCRMHEPDGCGYDVNGARAAQATPHRKLSAGTQQHPFFARKPPKSTDTPEMISAFTTAQLRLTEPLALDELLATAADITATSIMNAITFQLGISPDELIVSGGGRHNQAIMSRLREFFPPLVRAPEGQPTPPRVLTTDAFSIASEAKEALAFALLAAATLDNEPSNVPSVTGARRAVVLGSITARP